MFEVYKNMAKYYKKEDPDKRLPVNPRESYDYNEKTGKYHFDNITFNRIMALKLGGFNPLAEVRVWICCRSLSISVCRLCSISIALPSPSCIIANTKCSVPTLDCPSRTASSLLYVNILLTLGEKLSFIIYKSPLVLK